jgi:hypothetical protein
MNKIDLCKTIQMNVSKLTESENLELFKIILDTKANYTKNNNGIFLNLNWIEEELLVKINNYILFCIKSQNEISKYELMKTLLNEDMSSGGDCITRNSCDAAAAIADTSKDAGADASKDAVADASVATSATTDNTAGVGSTGSTGSGSGTGTGTDSSGQVIAASSTIPKQKFSSSMKFYLLKKKFMKQNTCYNACLENDLSYEDYLIT